MSNLFKSKFLLGVMVVAAFVVTVGVSAPKQAAADCTIMSTLRAGSVGLEVQCLQSIVGATADGKFGPMTAVAVKAWQAGHGLVADGVVGAMTRAAMMGAPTGNFPAGCTSASGYSSTTGMSCATGPSAGLPAGCSTTAGYSPLTGTKCDSTGPSTSGPLAGGAGTINSVDQVSSGTESDVQEGKDDVKVVGFDVDADGSDLNVTSVRVEFECPSVCAGSDHLDKYVSGVSVWLDGEKVGSVDASDFSENNNVYTKNIPVSDAVVRESKDGRFYVTVDALSNIDSGDFTSNWNVDVTQIRYEDSTGAIFSESGSGLPVSETGISFEDLASSGDLTYRISKGSGSPSAATVKADDSSDTDATLLEVKLKAEGSDMVVDTLKFDLIVAGANRNDAIDEVRLMMGSTELDSVDGSTLPASAGTSVITFTDLSDDLDLADGESVTLKLVVQVNEVDGATFATWDSSDTVTGSMTTTNRDAADVEDENGDQVDPSDRSGSVIGNVQIFNAQGINVTPGTHSASVTAVDLADNDLGVYTVKVTVEALDDDIFISQDGTVAYTAQGQLASSHAAIAAPTSISTVISSTADTEGTAYRIDGGSSEDFTFSVTINPVAVEEGLSIEGQLLTINFGFASGTPATDTYTVTATDLSKYRTVGVVIPD